MSRFIRCDRCTTENAVIGTVSLPPGWLNICGSDLCERCCETVRDFIRFRPSDADRLPVEPIPLEVGPTDAPPDKLFETAPEEKHEEINDSTTTATPNSEAPNKDECPQGAPTSQAVGGAPLEEPSLEERARTRKNATRKKLLGQDAILPDPRQPGAPA